VKRQIQNTRVPSLTLGSLPGPKTSARNTPNPIVDAPPCTPYRRARRHTTIAHRWLPQRLGIILEIAGQAKFAAPVMAGALQQFVGVSGMKLGGA